MVRGVIAFSPASGDPMAGCMARQWVESVDVPMLVMRPASEMEMASAQAQRPLMEAAGAGFRVVDDGVHGSSMLVDERTGTDMSEARAFVAGWLVGGASGMESGGR